MSDFPLLTNPYQVPSGIDLSQVDDWDVLEGPHWEEHVEEIPVRLKMYQITHRGQSIKVIESIDPFDATTNIVGPVGLAATFALCRSEELGKPTTAYTETRGVQHLSLEWFHGAVEEMGAIEIRKQLDYPDRTDITLDEIEGYARAYLDD